MRGACREFSEHQKVKVVFESHDVPGTVPSDISLGLFRVLQEALHNAARHSEAHQFQVQLWGTPNEVHLTVSDSGVDFELETASKSPGLGLISMQERAQLMKGTLSIESRPGRGTTVHVHVPLGRESNSVS
jgi:signal transduction histidine kinase